jgi:hypothetical protein
MQDYVIACATAGVVSWIDLLTEHRRHPFGDWRTIRWWFPIVVLDMSVAAALVAGGHVRIDTSDAATTTVTGTWFLAGALGPLGLRRPIVRVPASWQRYWGGKQRVGLTYVYDFVRIWLDQALDDAVGTLRRHDKKVIVSEVFANEWAPIDMACQVWDHVEELHTLETFDRQAIAVRLTAALDSPPSDEKAASAILAIIFEWRFRSLIDDMKKEPPDEMTIRMHTEQIKRGSVPPWEAYAAAPPPPPEAPAPD